MERIIKDSISKIEIWDHAAQTVMAGTRELDEQNDLESIQIVDRIVSEAMSLDDLRKGVKWVSALDAEAYLRSGGDICNMNSADYHEALARRIAHHAGRNALKEVKNQTRLEILMVKYKRQTDLNAV